MADYLTTDTELTSVANAIRTKGGTSAALVYPTGFVSAIEAINTVNNQAKTGINPTTSSQTITADNGYTGLSSVQINAMPSGTITNNTTLPSGSTSTGTINRGSYIKVGAGYHPETYYKAQENSGTKSITTADNANTNISVDGYANVNISGLNVSTGAPFYLYSSDASSFNISDIIEVHLGQNRGALFDDDEGCRNVVSLKGLIACSPKGNGYGEVKCSAYVNSEDTSQTASQTLIQNGRWVTTNVSAGGTYYGRTVVGSGSASTPATTVTANPTISINSSTGVITATASATQSVTPTISAGYISSGTAGTITVSGSNTYTLDIWTGGNY